MAKILTLIAAHLCMAPRPQKEAQALSSAGHEVLVQGMWFDDEMAARDKAICENRNWDFKPVVDFRPTTLAGKARGFNIRAKSKLARKAYEAKGIVSPELFGYGASAMHKVARASDADMIIVHSEAGLWAGCELIGDERIVGVDFEDWFSEDLLPEARKHRPTDALKKWEAELAGKCVYCLATSDAMSEAISKEYETSKPAVIYNSFPWKERLALDGVSKDRKNKDLPSIHWFSQTIGPGRGLEFFFDAARKIKSPCEVHLRGKLFPADQQWFDDLVPENWKERVFVHPTVPTSELLSRISEHDIGLALEKTDPPSRNLTVTNKVFQYMQGGLALVMSRTMGQQEIYRNAPDVGTLVESDDVNDLAQAIEDLVSNQEKLQMTKKASLLHAKESYSWEQQEAKLVALIDAALEREKK